jgi:hypothetical protein
VEAEPHAVVAARLGGRVGRPRADVQELKLGWRALSSDDIQLVHIGVLPVLRVLDEHNELWQQLGDDVRAWPPVFRDYARFESLRGVSPVRTCRVRCAVSDAQQPRVMAIYSGSQHHKFETKLPAGLSKAVERLLPYTKEELKIIAARDNFPAELHGHLPWLLNFTGGVPRDVSLIASTYPVNIRARGELVTIENLEKEFDSDRKPKMTLSHTEFMKTAGSVERKEWLENVKLMLLTESDDVPQPDPAYLDLGLLRFDRKGVFTFVNQRARAIVRTSYINYAPTLTLSDQELQARISAQIDSASVRGGVFEELVWVQLLSLPEPLQVCDELGVEVKYSVTLSGVRDFITLAKGEHVPGTSRGAGGSRLVRGYHAYPRWDFIYDGACPVFISASVSPFRSHDKDSAAIYKAFAPEVKWGTRAAGNRSRTQMEALMDALVPHNAPHTSSIVSTMELTLQEMHDVGGCARYQSR